MLSSQASYSSAAAYASATQNQARSTLIMAPAMRSVQNSSERTGAIQMNNDVAVQRSLSAGSNTGRPLPIVRHNSLDQDGPRIVGVSSLGRPVPTNDAQSLVNQQHQQQLLSQLRSNHSQSGRVVQQPEATLHYRSTHNERPASQVYTTGRPRDGQFQNLLHTKRMATHEDLEHQITKQPRVETNTFRGNQSQESLRQFFQNETNASQRSLLSGGPAGRLSSSIGDARPNMTASMRLGNAITVSVCANDSEKHGSVITSGRASNDLSSSPGSNGIRSNNVASALAIRGVTG